MKLIRGALLGDHRLHPVRQQSHDVFLVGHLLLFAILLVVAPFSKLLHAAGVFFSPTRHQRDDARERRHLAPWARSFDSRRG